VSTHNQFHRAHNAAPARDPDPYALLDYLPRESWEVVEARFHLACRHIYAAPEEVLAWLRRDLASTVRDLAQHPDFFRLRDALILLGRVVDERPEEDDRYARHIVQQEIAWLFSIETGQKDMRLRDTRNTAKRGNR
jgi:hypothetical protein